VIAIKNLILTKKISENVAVLDDLLGVDISYDVSHREFIIKNRKIQCYFVTGLCDATMSTELFKSLVDINDIEVPNNKLVETIDK